MRVGMIVTGLSAPPRARMGSERYWRFFADIVRGAVVTSMLEARNEARNEGGTYQRVEVITGRQRRRRWTAEEKARIVAESLEANANISDVARRHGVARGLLTAWRRQLSSDGISQEPQQGFAAVKIDTVAS